MLEIYYTNIREASWEWDMSPLSDYKKERLSQIKNIRKWKQSAATERLLIAALQDHDPQLELPLRFALGVNGKPLLKTKNLHCSFSHSGEWAACAVSDREIGLDIQTDTAGKTEIARRFFTEEEKQWLYNSPRPDWDFTRLWSVKESYVKATGAGLSCPLNTFSVKIGDRIHIAEKPQTGFWCAHTEGCHFSLCALEEPKPVPNLFVKKKLL